MEAPPILAQDICVAAPPKRAAWRWWLWCALLVPYPVLLGTIPILLKYFGVATLDGGSVLPPTTQGLWEVSAENVGLFLIILGIAWLAARPSLSELFMRGRIRIPSQTLSSFWLVPLSFVYSIAVRIPVSICLVVAVGIVYLLSHGDPTTLQTYRPKIEEVINPAALADPIYFFLTLTLLSFVVAGFREELWRTAAMIGLLRLLPLGWQGRKGQISVLALSSVVFGLGHLAQGPAGVLATTLLGFLLGGMTLYHRSMWLAVLTHGFFDATSFAALRVAQENGWLDQLLGK